MDIAWLMPRAILGCAALATMLIVMRTCGTLLTGVAIGIALMLLVMNPQLAAQGRATVVGLAGYLAPDESTADRLTARLRQFL